MSTRAAARVDRLNPAPSAARRQAVDRRESDAGFVVLAIAHAAALVFAPSIPLIAFGLWWNANTIAHNFIHRPFFRRGATNRLFAAVLTLDLGFPYELWRQRHLRHHAEAAGGPSRRLMLTPALVAESALIAVLWTALVLLTPRGFLLVYVPGWALGLGLCQLQGHFEHARGTTSHYGRFYNWLFFNDGYHVEHHLRPAMHWSRLPALIDPAWEGSRWPAVLRFLERPSHARAGRPDVRSRRPSGRRTSSALEFLERLVLHAPLLQRFVIDRHTRAFRRLLPSLGPVARITIIGGGLFPRTALILRTLMPHAAVTIVDASDANLETARRCLSDDVTYVHGVYEAGTTVDADLVVVPLAFRGDRRRFYEQPPAARVIVHDWMWRAHASHSGSTARVSWWLLKRLNLVGR